MAYRSLIRAWLRGWLCLVGAHDPLAGLGWVARTRIRSQALVQLLRAPPVRINLLVLCLLLLLARSLAWRADLEGFWRDAWLITPFLLLAPDLFLRHRLQVLRLLRTDARAVVRPSARCSNRQDEDTIQTDHRTGGAEHCADPGGHHLCAPVRRSERLSGRD